MKQLLNSDIGQTGATIFFNKIKVSQARFNDKVKKGHSTKSRNFQLLTPTVKEEIANGQLPNLEKVCYDLIETFRVNNFPFKALQFSDVLKRIRFEKDEVRQLLNHDTKKHVLVENELIKIVLICWSPNDFTSIHGHPSGGCMFKVLAGKLVEKRYSPDDNLKLLAKSTFSKGAMAYIDDTMALHAVENPFKSHAISIHVYTPGHK